MSTFQYPELLARASRALSREGRPSSPHTALAGAICSHSSEFFTSELLNSGLSCQQAALLWGLRRACNSEDGALPSNSEQFRATPSYSEWGAPKNSELLRATPSHSKLLRATPSGAQELRATPSYSEPLQATQTFSEWRPRTPSYYQEVCHIAAYI